MASCAFLAFFYALESFFLPMVSRLALAGLSRLPTYRGKGYQAALRASGGCLRRALNFWAAGEAVATTSSRSAVQHPPLILVGLDTLAPQFCASLC